MKKQIRNNAWETNSSSIHTLAISKKNMGRCHLKIKDDGYVHIKLTEYFGKDEKDYTTQYEKLVYVVTWMYIYYGCELPLRDKWYYSSFEKAFCKYINNELHRTPIRLEEPECKGIMIDDILGSSPYDYLDHQSVPYDNYDDSKCIVPLYNADELINFIFNKNLWLHTDCD